jgi:plastocyanin
MKGKITVQERGAKVPHEQADYDQLAAEQLARLTEEGKAEAAKYAKATVAARGDGTTLWEATAGAGAGQARVQLMLPGTLEIKVGDTVRWVPRSPGEPHTVTFASGVEPAREPIIEPQANGAPRLLANPQVQFPVGGSTYNGKEYVNSGFLGKEWGGAESYELTFDTPGEFICYCVLHGDAAGQGMAGKVIVSAR